MNHKYKKIIFTFLCIIVGSLIASFNIKSFVGSAGLFPGGFSGVTILIQRVLKFYFNVEISYSFLNMGLNVVPAIIAYRYVGKKFTIFSIIAIITTAIFVDLIPPIRMNGDMILLSIFGGILNGVSISVLLKGKLSSGGTDFIAMAISNKWKISTWNYVLIFNAIIIIISGLLFDWNVALYSILFQFCSIQVVNTFHIRYKKVSLFIISDKVDEIGDALITNLHHGVTKFDGIGCYSNSKRSMLYTVLSEEQLKVAVKVIRGIDSYAFVNVVRTEQINGLFSLDPFE